MADVKKRCDWCGDDPQYMYYHDEEWGVPVYDDRVLFEFLILEGAQAGLNWITILRKREGYRKAFAGFDVSKIAKFTEAKQQELLQNPEIIRNKLKVKSATKNALAFIEIQAEFGSFSNYLWGYVDNKPIKNKFKSMTDVPAVTPLAEDISKDLKKRGMSFVGPTIVYAYLQAVGVVNDHTIDCFRYNQI